MCTFGVKMYSIVSVPLNTPTVLYLQYHRAARDCWRSAKLCDVCSEEFQLLLQPFVGTCTSDRSCGCNVWLRHPHHSEIYFPTQSSITLSIHCSSHCLTEHCTTNICMLWNRRQFPNRSWFHLQFLHSHH